MILYTGNGHNYDVHFHEKSKKYSNKVRIIDDEYQALINEHNSVYIIGDEEFIVENIILDMMIKNLDFYLSTNRNSMYLSPSWLINYNNYSLLENELNRIKELNLLTEMNLNSSFSLKKLSIIGNELEKYVINTCLIIELLPFITVYIINTINKECNFEFITIEGDITTKNFSNLLSLEFYENYEHNKKLSTIYTFIVELLQHNNFSSIKMVNLINSFIEDFNNQNRKTDYNNQNNNSLLPF
ncbi:hypothetical protein ACE193_11400 [Bernardetia sp. OM2101]|uniref:hypothetical protein n=1 Tax=Bernardetia sp. OM2101 TaxID=3344876 RepID=UPI0035CE98DA